MASRKELTRNNVRAGLFVSLALVLMVAVIVILTDALTPLLHVTEEYHVIYDVRRGVANLQRGGEVRVGGVAMGRVTDVQPVIEPGAPLERITVAFELERAVPLYRDASVLIVSQLLGANAWIEIYDVGTPVAGSARGIVIEGVSAPGLLATLLGPENADRADALVEDAASFASFLGRVEQEYDARLKPVLDDLGTAATDVRTVTSDLRQTRWPHWSESIDQVMGWTGEFTGQLDQAVADGLALVGDGREVIAENRSAIRASVDNLEEATTEAADVARRVNDETLGKVHAFLDRGQVAMDDAAAALTSARQDFAGWSGGIDDTLANLSLTSQQLKLASQEIRRSPWKLLYRPSPKELEHELLYEAARSFALGATELSAAAGALSRVVDGHGDELAEDRAVFERLLQNLTDASEKYQKAQQQLFDVLVSSP